MCRKKISIDNDGFLTNPDDWNEDVAQMFAEREGIGALDGFRVMPMLAAAALSDFMITATVFMLMAGRYLIAL